MHTTNTTSERAMSRDGSDQLIIRPDADRLGGRPADAAQHGNAVDLEHEPTPTGGNGTGNSPALSSASFDAEKLARLAAQEVVDQLRGIDRDARRAGRTIPTGEEREAVVSSFWQAIREFAALEQDVRGVERERCAAAVREVLNPWLLRSSYWSRSYLKPHGYAGDFRMLEWMYDLEDQPCADPTKPAVVNLLDHLYSTVHSVRAVSHRRRWFAQLINHQLANAGDAQPVRVLDLACGGSRYLRDSIASDLGRHAVEVTLMDQDPAALAFVDSWLPNRTRASTRLICGPVRHVRRLVLESALGGASEFDLVISTGLFDYLDDDAARRLLAEMTGLTRPGGIVAVCNFAPEDSSRIVKDWVVDWQLIYRSASELRALVPDGHPVVLERSPDGGLVYARVDVTDFPTRPDPTPFGEHVRR